MEAEFCLLLTHASSPPNAPKLQTICEERFMTQSQIVKFKLAPNSHSKLLKQTNYSSLSKEA